MAREERKAAKSCGLCIKLEKDLLGERGSADGGEHVLGYFDRVYIDPVKRWLDYSPRNSAPQNSLSGESGEVDCGKHSRSISAYPIKLLFPPTKSIQKLERGGLDYASWRVSGSGNENELSKLFEENPCITAILINLTDEFKGALPRDICGKQLLCLAQVIKEAAQRERASYSQEDLTQAHCCILPSLGYSDYCILLAEKQWSVALALTAELRRALYDEKVPVLSTDYIMPIYHVKAGGDSFFSQGDMRLSVRVNLWPGVSIEQLRSALGNNVDIYQTSGASDCLLVSEDPGRMTRLLCELVGEKAANSVLNMAVMTEGALCRKIETIEAIETSESARDHTGKRSSLLDDVIKELYNTLDKYGKLLQDNHRHMRQFSAMHQRVTAIKNICGECHNASIQHIMLDWLPAFTDCLERCTAQLQAQLEMCGDPSVREDLEIFWGSVEEALECFIDQVGSFMADLSRSDCFFFETEQCNHPSVSSATALLIAYNRWQNSFVRDVVEEDNKGASLSYPFLVRSGGCDSTHTTNLFYFLDHEVDKDGKCVRENIPLISQMSEMSLFDCAGAVFRMTHECLHFCGRRYRRERLDYIIEFVSCYYGRALSEAMLNKLAHCEKPVQDLARMGIGDTDLYDAMERGWRKVCNSLQKEISARLAEMLEAEYKKDRTQWQEPNYMSFPLGQWLKGQLAVLFSSYSYKAGVYSINPLVSFLYQAQQEAAIRLYKSYDTAVRKANSNFAAFELEHQRIARAVKADQELVTASGKTPSDPGLERTIIHILNQFLISADYAAGAGDLAANAREIGLNNALAVIFECFSECFADLEACLRLKPDLDDYILSFVFENWSVDMALPLDMQTTFRVSAALRLCFTEALTKDKSALNKDAKSALEAAIKGLKDGGLPEDRIAPKALTQRIDQLLQEYAKYPGEVAALEKYLDLCKKKYEESHHKKMGPYAQAFRGLKRYRDSAITEDGAAEMFADLTTIGGLTDEHGHSA